MIKAVISGSFHQDGDSLQRLFSELETCGLRILSPLSLDFIDTTESVVKAQHDDDFDIGMLEGFHLRAIREADIVIVHAPGGYVGLSTSFEIGYAVSRHVPVVSRNQINDTMLQSYVAVHASVFDALKDSQLI